MRMLTINKKLISERTEREHVANNYVSSLNTLARHRLNKTIND